MPSKLLDEHRGRGTDDSTLRDFMFIVDCPSDYTLTQVIDRAIEEIDARIPDCLEAMTHERYNPMRDVFARSALCLFQSRMTLRQLREFL